MHRSVKRSSAPKFLPSKKGLCQAMRTVLLKVSAKSLNVQNLTQPQRTLCGSHWPIQQLPALSDSWHYAGCVLKAGEGPLAHPGSTPGWLSESTA